MEMVSHEKVGLMSGGFVWVKGLFAKLVEVASKTRALGKDDPRRVIHSLKLGLTLTIVSMLYYYKPLFANFGVSAMWAVMTVVVVFEFSVGMIALFSFLLPLFFVSLLVVFFEFSMSSSLLFFFFYVLV